MSNALIVVDMQRCFLEEGKSLYCGPMAREIIPRVKALLERESQRGTQIFFTADTHDKNDLEFRMFPPHCIAGTEESRIIPELEEFVKPENVIHKRRYSAFFETNLADRLAALEPEVVYVCGVCTDICVMHSVADMRNRDYHVVVYEDCVQSFDPEAHRFALKHMKEILGAEIRRFTEEQEATGAGQPTQTATR